MTLKFFLRIRIDSNQIESNANSNRIESNPVFLSSNRIELKLERIESNRITLKFDSIRFDSFGTLLSRYFYLCSFIGEDGDEKIEMRR